MPWVRLDDGFPDHPKVVRVGPLAAWLHVCALAYCNRYLTDGIIPKAQVPKLADFDTIAQDGADVDCVALAERLVTVGMWRHIDGGYEIHDYLEYQPSKAKVEAERAQKAEAGRKGGKAKAQAGQQAESKQSAKHPLKQNPSTSEAEALAEPLAKSKPVPVPVPVPDPVPNPHPTVDEFSTGSASPRAEPGGGDNGDSSDTISAAVSLAAQRYAEHQVAKNGGRSADGLAKWWLQENAVGARERAVRVLAEFDVTTTQLADVLSNQTPPQWLRHHRRTQEAS